MNESLAGRESDFAPDALIVSVLIEPVLDVLTTQPFLARMTIATDGPSQVDVIKIVGSLLGEVEAGMHYTYEVYSWAETPRVRDALDAIIGDWHATPQAAFRAGLSALALYPASQAAGAAPRD